MSRINPLSYIALTNYYKFVSIGRKNKAGGENRKPINEKFESEFSMDEVKILDPDIIIFQSKNFWHEKKLLNNLLRMEKLVYIGPHPSWRRKNGRKPSYFVKQISKYK